MVLNPLRVVGAPRLARVRLVLHHAARLLVTNAPAVAAPLRWALGERVLWGPPAGGRQVGLRLGAVQLLTRDVTSGATSSLSLAHQTLATAQGWLASGAVLHPSSLRHHAVLAGGRFPAPSQASLQLEREFQGAAQLLVEVGAPRAEWVAVSPDTLALSVRVASRGGALTVGFSPGEDVAESPFWFARRDSDAVAVVGARDVGPLDAERAPLAVDVVRRFLSEAFALHPLEG